MAYFYAKLSCVAMYIHRIYKAYVGFGVILAVAYFFPLAFRLDPCPSEVMGGLSIFMGTIVPHFSFQSIGANLEAIPMTGGLFLIECQHMHIGGPQCLRAICLLEFPELKLFRLASDS